MLEEMARRQESRFDRLEDKFDRLEVRLSQIQADIARLSGQVSNLPSTWTLITTIMASYIAGAGILLAVIKAFGTH